MRDGFRHRLNKAHTALEARELQKRLESGLRRTIGKSEIGERVAKELGWPEPVPPSTVASWFGEILPPADVGAGLAQVYGVWAGWLYFGEEQEPHRVEIPAEPKQPPPIELQEKASAKRKRNG